MHLSIFRKHLFFFNISNALKGIITLQCTAYMGKIAETMDVYKSLCNIKVSTYFKVVYMFWLIPVAAQIGMVNEVPVFTLNLGY